MNKIGTKKINNQRMYSPHRIRNRNRTHVHKHPQMQTKNKHSVVNKQMSLN